jgi:hypothetical protein
MLVGPDGTTTEAPPPSPPPPPPHHVAIKQHMATNVANPSTQAPGATPASSTAFNDAVQSARTARAAANGEPPWTHGYETAIGVAG